MSALKKNDANAIMQMVRARRKVPGGVAIPGAAGWFYFLVLFYFILFYFILFYFILFYFILFF